MSHKYACTHKYAFTHKYACAYKYACTNKYACTPLFVHLNSCDLRGWTYCDLVFCRGHTFELLWLKISWNMGVVGRMAMAMSGRRRLFRGWRRRYNRLFSALRRSWNQERLEFSLFTHQILHGGGGVKIPDDSPSNPWGVTTKDHPLTNLDTQ